MMNLNPRSIKPPASVAEARLIQEELGKKVRIRPLRKQPRLVAGLDASFTGGKRGKARGAVCLYTYPELEPVEEATAELDITFPYVPGLLTFREGPALLAALMKLRGTPDLLLFDGQGIAHPTGMGIAAHMGALLDMPSIGCAKSRLVGEFREPARRKGSRAKLVYAGETVGAVLRTRDGVRPLFVSPGHMADIESSIEIALGCTTRYRIPEPLRCADRLSKVLK
jgi:deoxyribonuclease V